MYEIWTAQKKKYLRVLKIDFGMSFVFKYKNEVLSALCGSTSMFVFAGESFSELVAIISSYQTYHIWLSTTNKDKNTIFASIEILCQYTFHFDKNRPQ